VRTQSNLKITHRQLKSNRPNSTRAKNPFLPKTPKRDPNVRVLLRLKEPLHTTIALHRRRFMGPAKKAHPHLLKIHGLHHQAAGLGSPLPTHQLSLPQRHQTREHPHSERTLIIHSGNCEDLRLWLGCALYGDEEYEVWDTAVPLAGDCEGRGL
jgi:hypothetical protein